MRSSVPDHTLVDSPLSFKSSTTSAYVKPEPQCEASSSRCCKPWMNMKANSRPQVLVDGPSEKEEQAVPRHAAGLSYMSLTGIVIPKLPRAIGHSALKKKWEEHEVEKKWYESNFA